MTADLLPAPKTAASMRFTPVGGLIPTNFDEAWRMAQLFSRSELVPKDYYGKAENCLVAIQMGAELGLKPLQSLQGIAVINGRPSVWGDALWALVQSHPLVDDAAEVFDPHTMTATCSIKRRGRSSWTVQKFSQEDAALAKLWNKSGPWQTNPRRMLQMRARAFAARDAVPDVLKGLAVAEEAMDIPAPTAVQQPSGVAALRAAAEKARQTPPEGQVAPQEAEATVGPTEPGTPEDGNEAQSAGPDLVDPLDSRVADYAALLDEATSVQELDDLAKGAPEDVRADANYLAALWKRSEALLKAKK